MRIPGESCPPRRLSTSNRLTQVSDRSSGVLVRQRDEAALDKSRGIVRCCNRISAVPEHRDWLLPSPFKQCFEYSVVVPRLF